jgi:hypothetical protein
MTAANEGEKFRSKITGRVYNLIKTVDQMVVLETPDGTNQVLTGLDSLTVFYEGEPKTDEDQE